MTDTLLFNPLDPQLCVDPYPEYARLREAEPIHQSPLGFWFLTRHADVTQFFREKAFEHQYILTQQMRLGEDVVEQDYFKLFRLMVFVLDNPDHRRIRQMFSSTFTPRRVAALRPRVEEIAGELLDAVEADGGMDLIESYSRLLPIRVIGELLGIPETDHETIGRLADRLNPALEFLPMDDPTLAAANAATVELADYFRELATKRAADPTDDLFSDMVAAQRAGDLTEDELLANAILMYVAGHETSNGATGLAMLALHRNPDQLDLLRSKPELLPNAVEELLRYDTPGQATARVSVAPVTIGDVEIPAGTGVVGYIGAANRDPEAYPDPDRLDLERDVQGLTSFGGGAHYCIGHALARQELEIAIGGLLRRFPDHVADLDAIEFRQTALMRGLTTMPLTW